MPSLLDSQPCHGFSRRLLDATLCIAHTSTRIDLSVEVTLTCKQLSTVSSSDGLNNYEKRCVGDANNAENWSTTLKWHKVNLEDYCIRQVVYVQPATVLEQIFDNVEAYVPRNRFRLRFRTQFPVILRSVLRSMRWHEKTFEVPTRRERAWFRGAILRRNASYTDTDFALRWGMLRATNFTQLQGCCN